MDIKVLDEKIDPVEGDFREIAIMRKLHVKGARFPWVVPPLSHFVFKPHNQGGVKLGRGRVPGYARILGENGRFGTFA